LPLLSPQSPSRASAFQTVNSETSLHYFFQEVSLANIILSFQKTATVSISSILFGSITTIGSNDLLIINSAGIVGILLILIFFKEFFMIAIDEEYALERNL
jgi:filamentous hemagglutinin family protein